MTALFMTVGRPHTLPVDMLLATIPSLPRATLNHLVDRAIDRMDQDDGDPDDEEDEDHA